MERFIYKIAVICFVVIAQATSPQSAFSEQAQLESLVDRVKTVGGPKLDGQVYLLGGCSGYFEAVLEWAPAGVGDPKSVELVKRMQSFFANKAVEFRTRDGRTPPSKARPQVASQIDMRVDEYLRHFEAIGMPRDRPSDEIDMTVATDQLSCMAIYKDLGGK